MSKTFEEVLAEMTAKLALRGVVQVDDGHTIRTWIKCEAHCNCSRCCSERDLRARGIEPMPRAPDSIIVKGRR